MTKEGVTIPQYFAGKHVFITGGTGFMGKVLIEKLLRSCPDVSKVYVLVREKKGKSPDERVRVMTDVALFDRLKKENPENLKKIVPIYGNVTELGLGINSESKKLLIENVNIVYHAAASVRFDDSLRDAILMNTRGTREVVYLALEMERLEVLAHFSTTYCNTDRKEIGEQMYPPHADWREAITLAENGDPHVLDILTQKYMGELPNTYTFAKSLAEHVVNDLCSGRIPSIIFRPSIVISTVKEPMPGWIDNFNGPVGILIASGKGILRSIYTNPNVTADYVPVDLVTKGIIIATWLKGLEAKEEEKLTLSVYNASNNNINNVTVGGLVELGRKLCWDYPLNDILWYPNGSVTQCYVYHFLRLIFYHILPAILIDGILKITGHQPMLLRIQRKIYIANMALQYFITQDWKFINEKTSDLENKLLPPDKENFYYDKDRVVPYEYFTKALYGARQYLLKEDISTFDRAKTHSKRMWVLSKICNGLAYAGLFYLIFVKYDIFGRLCRLIVAYFDSLG
ncbi:fatty acyl-CoA reductase 1-like isoform X2 [Cylas formicarius]|nr:fatty acyl-CoA reductase 1-like isoform X2 [Cylas formicarius]XP_060533067.1 fatty acyl-CoA reductase 1-like isoform X2 [Cylas formicarius]XP_060533068.1 fatty acyl-CoA reductase 1-like isoform X2 [Cylas formicarius]